jgi:hypothetical protein
MEKIINIHVDYDKELIIKDTSIENIQLYYCEFKEAVSLINCKIETAFFLAAYFIKGLTIKECEFMSDVDFTCGDTCNGDSIFRIENIIFYGFADFQDYVFRGKVILGNVNFKCGTNLLGTKNTPVEVTFYTEPILINVIGELGKNDY